MIPTGTAWPTRYWVIEADEAIVVDKTIGAKETVTADLFIDATEANEANKADLADEATDATEATEATEANKADLANKAN